MARINLVMQGKGGVGKSVVASLFTQYVRDVLGQVPVVIDTDPINQTLSEYAAFDTHGFELFGEQRTVDPRNFDLLMLHVDGVGPEREVIIDSGASTFIELVDYLREGEVPNVLAEQGHEFVVHVVISGGPEQNATLGGLSYVLRSFDSATIVVWLNHFHAPIRRDGLEFGELPLYLSNKERIHHVVDIPRHPGLVARDVQDVFMDKVTFEEAIRAEGRDIYVKRRLMLAQRRLYRAIEASGVVGRYG